MTWTPTTGSPSAEDFAGWTLDTGLAVVAGTIAPIYWGFRYLRLFVTLPSQTIVGAIQYENSSGAHVVPGELGWRMTASNAPSPFVVSATPTDLGAGFVEWKCFDGLQATGWNGYPGSATKWLLIDLGAPTQVSLIRLFPSLFSGTGAPYAPTTFRVEGSNTGAFAGEEVTLLSVVGYTWADTTGVAWPLTYPTGIGAPTATSGAFAPTGGAKLATYVSLTPTFTGAGTVRVYAQHTNTITGSGWFSLAGIKDEWTDLGLATSGAAITGTLAATECRASEQCRFKLVLTSADGLTAPPTVTALSLAWTSDTTAAAVPTITQLISCAGTGPVNPAPRLDIAAVPTGARHVEVEVDYAPVATGVFIGYLPISQRNKGETGYGYMAFRGAQTTTEAAVERQELRIAIPGAFAVGDKFRAKARSVDAVGNASAWSAASDTLTLADVQTLIVSGDKVTVTVGNPDTIRVEVLP